MSDAYKCDRCGEFFEAFDVKQYIDPRRENALGNLCPSCENKLEAWWSDE